MKLIITVIVGFGCLFLALGEEYNSRFDNIDIDEILRSDRLLKNYASCILDKGPCSPDGKELKRILPEAIRTNCAKCNDKQKTGAKKIISHLVKHQPGIWNEICVMYDADGTFRSTYLKEWTD